MKGRRNFGGLKKISRVKRGETRGRWKTDSETVGKGPTENRSSDLLPPALTVEPGKDRLTRMCLMRSTDWEVKEFV